MLEEKVNLKTLYEKLLTDTDNDKNYSREQLITRILMAPEFLYKKEIGVVTESGERVLGPFEIASFVSYAVTGDMPDDQLFEDAESGKIKCKHCSQPCHKTFSNR